MQKLNGFSLISALNRLSKNIKYPLPDKDDGGYIEIVRVEMPEGPIVLRTKTFSEVDFYDPDDTISESADIIINKDIIWRVADNLFEAHPLSLTRLLGIDPQGKAALLETMLAYTAEFYLCYPGRMEHIAGNAVDRRGEQYLIWLPSDPHENAKLSVKNYSADISEIPSTVAVYEALEIKGAPKLGADKPTSEILRRHIQIQVALYYIGLQMGYHVWFKKTDDAIYLNNMPIEDSRNIINKLEETPPFADNPEALKLAEDMDIIWFAKDGTIPAAIAVEFYKGISGTVMNMLELKQKLPKNAVGRYVIAAPDEDRGHTVSVSTKAFNRSLSVRYFPYSSVEELFSLCRRRNIKGVSEEFLDCFIEKFN
jgi:type II restriction enzyme